MNWQADDHAALFRFCERLEHVSWITAVNNWVVSSVLLELTHYFGFFLLVGTIAAVDLRVLGIIGRRDTDDQLGKQLFPLMWTGLALAILSGFVMFAGQATLLYPNPVFRAKLLVIAFAISFGVVVQTNLPKWNRMPSVPKGAKLIALVSLMLWVAAILAAVEIPHLTYVP